MAKTPPKGSMEPCSAAEYYRYLCKHHGFSGVRQTIYKAVRSGRIPASNGMIIPAQADRVFLSDAAPSPVAARAVPVAPAAVMSVDPSGGGVGLPPALLRGMASARPARHRATLPPDVSARLYELEAARLKMEKETGQLVRVEDVQSLLVSVATTARTGLESIPADLADELAAESDPDAVRKALADKVREVLEELARGVRMIGEQGPAITAAHEQAVAN